MSGVDVGREQESGNRRRGQKTRSPLLIFCTLDAALLRLRHQLTELFEMRLDLVGLRLIQLAVLRLVQDVLDGIEDLVCFRMARSRRGGRCGSLRLIVGRRWSGAA